MNWWRAYHGLPYDSKLAVVAKKSGSRRGDVLAVWVACLDYASQHEDRGTIRGIDPEEIAVSLDMETPQVSIILEAFEGRGMLSAGRVVAWERRQPVREREDDSVERVRKYRDRVRQGGGTVGGYLRHQKEVFDRDGHACVYCGEDDAKKLCLDHGVPVCQGGDDDPMNLYTACKRCNSGKSGRTPKEARYAFRNPSTAALFEQNLSRMSRAKAPIIAPVTPCHAKDTPEQNREEQNREEHKPLCATGVALVSVDEPPFDFLETVPECFGKGWFDREHERWYSTAYWKRVGKSDSRKAYEKRVRVLVSASVNHENAARFLYDQAVADKARFEVTADWEWRRNLHPATWLNQARWEDEPQAGGHQNGHQSANQLRRDERIARMNLLDEIRRM